MIAEVTFIFTRGEKKEQLHALLELVGFEVSEGELCRPNDERELPILFSTLELEVDIVHYNGGVILASDSSPQSVFVPSQMFEIVKWDVPLQEAQENPLLISDRKPIVIDKDGGL